MSPKFSETEPEVFRHVFYTGGKQYRHGDAQPAACGKEKGQMSPGERALAITAGGYNQATDTRKAEVCPACRAKLERSADQVAIDRIETATRLKVIRLTGESTGHIADLEGGRKAWNIGGSIQVY